MADADSCDWYVEELWRHVDSERDGYGTIYAWLKCRHAIPSTKSGLGSRSFIQGPSTRNDGIERLRKDVHQSVVKKIKHLFN